MKSRLAPQSPVIGEDNEEEPENKQPAEEPKPEDGGDEAGIENENEEEESAEAPQSLSAASGQYGFTAQGALPSARRGFPLSRLRTDRSLCALRWVLCSGRTSEKAIRSMRSI